MPELTDFSCQCDLKIPQCSQCVRLNVSCFGYRDTHVLAIRDETLHVVQKARRSRKRRTRSEFQTEDIGTSTVDRAPILSQYSPGEEYKEQGGRNRPGQPMLFTLLAPPEEIALGYFLFVFSNNSPFSYLPEYLPALMDYEDVMQAIYASALAALALCYRCQRLICEARSYYAKALSRTNKALSEPHTAILDKTLLCVLLLTAFEALTFRGRSSPRNWNLHVQGSTNILVLRQTAQIDTELGRHLMYHASVNTLANCTTYRLPIPTAFRRLQGHAVRPQKAATESPGVDHVRRHLIGIMMRFATISASLKGMLATELVTKCFELDAEAAALLDVLREHMPYQIINVASDNEELRKATKGIKVCAYKDVIHMYQTQQDARLFNSMRLMRLVLNEWIFCAFDNSLRGIISNDEPHPGSDLSENWTELPQKAAQQAAEHINDILASVPYSLELLPSAFRMTARSLVWPLSATAGSEVCPLEAKLYIIVPLKKLACLHDLAQAKEAATMLEEGVKLEDW